MALGRKNSDQSNSTLIFLSPRTKDEKGEKADPHFLIRKKVDGEWVQAGSVDRFSGNLSKIESKEIPLKKGGKMELITVTVEDPETEEKYVADFGFKVATRGLFNRLINLETFENIEISYWENDKGYDVLSLRQNNEPVKAKYTKEEIPQVQEVKLRGETVRDYILVDTFYKEELAALNDKIKVAPKTENVEKKAPKEETGPDYHDVSGIDDESVPF